MPNQSQKLTVYVDVDDTFVRTFGTKRIPIRSVIEHLRALYAQGAEMYCWSSGGAEYAMTSATEFGIGDCFRAFLPKPNVLIDDQRVEEWRRFMQVHPASDVTETVDDYWAKVNSLARPGT